MLFNSLAYFIFLPIVYLGYRFLNHRGQNFLLLVASYIFYGWWDIRFLFLIVLSTVTDFVCGILIHNGRLTSNERWTSTLWAITTCFLFVTIQWKTVFEGNQSLHAWWEGIFVWDKGWNIFWVLCLYMGSINALYPLIFKLDEQRRRKLFLVISIFTNLSILGFFKYYNFFIANLESTLSLIGFDPAMLRLNIILPVGISFYTFQTLSYTIDIYNRKMEPTTKFFDFALFVSFFPQLVAGPIERASRLLPQITRRRVVSTDVFFRGLHLIVYGLFKKVVIADGVARTVNQIYGSPGPSTWIEVVVATLLFAIQIYCDFSGYSDIARGTSKLFGIELMVNFNLPYFSRNPREFWSRWHISLSTWLRDYLYIPLGGNRYGASKTYRNLMITMLLGGLWHGAAWNFVLWGVYHGCLLCTHRLISSIQLFQRSTLNRPIFKVFSVVFFFILTSYGWLLFRAPSWGTIIDFTRVLLFDWGNFEFRAVLPTAAAIFGLPILVCIEFYEKLGNVKSFYMKIPVPLSTFGYASMIFVMVLGVNNDASQFIYFTF